MMQTAPRSFLLALTCLVFMVTSSIAFAKKIELSGGLFSFESKNTRANTSASLSGVGSYHIAFKYGLLDQYELDAGYSLIATKGLGGDLSFGFDLGANYFPTSLSDDYRFENSTAKAKLEYHWRPYVGIGFHQRNFQSTSTQYAGWGLKVGAEKSWTPDFQWIGSIRYGLLSGPNQSTATQIELLIGGVFNFW
jgi:hypothetical protein